MRVSEYRGSLASLLASYGYRPDLTPRLDAIGGKLLSQAIVNEIVLWKVNRYVPLKGEDRKKIDGLRSLKRGEHRNACALIELLLRTKGIDIAMASTILRFRNPEVFQIMDRHAYRAIYGLESRGKTRVEEKVDEYFEYLDKLISLCKKNA